MVLVLIAFLLAFLFSAVLGPFVIKLAKKVGAKQEILEYVTAHKAKQGTPTMGGLIFVLPAILISVIFAGGNSTMLFVGLGVFASYALLGFLDDFIKVKTHKNLGLRAYQKTIGELGIALIIGLYMYYTHPLGAIMYVPVVGSVNISWWVIPLTIFVFLATTNSANLTDGLDGLAGSTSFVMLIVLTAITLITAQDIALSGGNLSLTNELNNLSLLGATTAGGVLAFLCFNAFPAKIFMGDTGSLALGGVICTLATFSGYVVLLPIIAFIFVLSAVSVIIQVLHFKRTKKRIFLMSPLHHHFQSKGVAEPKIVAIYTIISVICGIIALLLCIV